MSKSFKILPLKFEKYWINLDNGLITIGKGEQAMKDIPQDSSIADQIAAMEAHAAPWRSIAGEEVVQLREALLYVVDVIKNSEMWQAGAVVRSLRPENWKK